MLELSERSAYASGKWELAHLSGEESRLLDVGDHAKHRQGVENARC